MSTIWSSPETIVLAVVGKIFVAVVLYQIFPWGKKKCETTEARTRWRSFQILQENVLSNTSPTISEQPSGLALTAEGVTWNARTRLLDDRQSESIRFRPALFSGGKVLKAFISNRETCTLRYNQKTDDVELQLSPARAKSSSSWEIIGKATAQDWELRRDDRTIATAYPRPASPENGQKDRFFALEVLASEDPLFPLTVATGIEILRRSK